MTDTKAALLRLHVIRHGETEWSLSGQHTGSTDIPLTAHGEEEARALVPWMRYIPFTRALRSPRQRALRTCELVGLGATVEMTPDLAEWEYGDYEGRRSADIHKANPDWVIFRDGCPGGETPAQVGARADRLIADLRLMHGNIALFSHGHFSCVLAARWLGLEVIEAQHLSLSTASLSILGYAPNHPDVPVVLLWNATPAVLATTT